MVLTKSELIGSLQHEVRILLHLASKIDRPMLDYRPTAKQRSTLELLQYLTIMGPELVKAATAGQFDVATWTAREQAAKLLDFDGIVAEIATHPQTYKTLIGAISDEAFREPITMFGCQTTRGAFLVNLVLCGCAAYRTQIFLYLKACGREDLSTMNLWAGADAPAPAQS
jgi:hypothetical protein